MLNDLENALQDKLLDLFQQNKTKFNEKLLLTLIRISQ